MPEKGEQKADLPSRFEYQERVLTPSSWINQADELIQASKKLQPSIKRYWLTVSKYFDPNKGTYNPPPHFKPKRLLQATYFMLVAYAIENYFKAVMIAMFEKTYRNEILKTGKLPKALKTDSHDLVALAQRINFALSKIDTSLLIRLSRNSLWQGRYPVPINANQLNSMVIRNHDAFFTAFLAPSDIGNLNILTRRIRKFCANRTSSPKK